MKLIKNDRFVKKVNAIETTVTSDLVKKASYNTKIGETEKKNLIMIMKYILLLNNWISYLKKTLLQD